MAFTFPGTYRGSFNVANQGGAGVAFNDLKGLVYTSSYSPDTLMGVHNYKTGTPITNYNSNQPLGASNGGGFGFDRLANKFVLTNENGLHSLGVDSNGYPTGTWQTLPVTNFSNINSNRTSLGLGCNGAGLWAFIVGGSILYLVESSALWGNTGVIKKTVNLPVNFNPTGTNSNRASIGVTDDYVYYSSGNARVTRYKISDGSYTHYNLTNGSGGGVGISHDGTRMGTNNHAQDHLYLFDVSVENSLINPPQKPSTITVPPKAKVGDSVTPSWSSVPVPTQPSGNSLDQNVVFYELSLYNGSSWTVVADSITALSRAVTVPSMSDTTTARFRLRAYVLFGGQRYYTNFADGTEYTTSSNFQVYNNNVPTTPSAFQTPTVSQAPVKTGTTLRVAWGAATDADNEALTYELSFTQNGTTWTVLSPSISTTYYDHVIPTGDSSKAQYRVRAKDPKGDFGDYRVSTAFQKFDNTAPSNPGSFSFPKSTDILSPGDVVRVAFAPAVDPEGDTITYELDLSTDNGVTYVSVTRNLPVAFFEYTFPQIAPTEQAKYRVRSKDSNGDYSSYSYSDTFRIWTTIPPEKPVLQLLNGSPDIPNIVQYLNPNVAWQFTDRNRDDVQAHYQVQIFRKGTTDTLVHDSGKRAGNFNVYALPMNVIQWGNIYYYQVKVWDNKGGESQWSDRGYFKPNRSPFVSNLYPGALNKETPEVSSATPKLGWTFDDPDGDEQVEYFLTMHKTETGTADDPIIYESGFISSNERFHQIPEDTLEDGVHYHWRVSVNDRNGLMDTSEFEYIITNYRAIAPSIVSPVDNHRVPTRPVIEGKLSTDVENDKHHVSAFLKNLKSSSVSTYSSDNNTLTYLDDEGKVVEPIEGSDEEFNTEGLTVVSAWEVQDADGKWIPFPKEGVDNTFSGRKFRVTIPTDLELWTSYEFQFGATDAGSKKLQMGSEKRKFRVGNEMHRRAFTPIPTYYPASRIYLTADVILAEDVDKEGGKPSEVIVEACNNANDENPTWENMTEEYLAGTFYEFINNDKTDDDWAVDFRITVKAHDSQGPISIGMYGGTFE